MKDYSYTAYGLSIQSSLPISELPATAVAADVTVRLDKVERSPPPAATARDSWWATSKQICLSYGTIGAIMVRDGCEIVVDPIPGVGERILAWLILGPAMGLLLHQRGLLVLHASAVELNGAAVIFLGGAGWGKSTMAATLHARGHSVVADDLVALDPTHAKGPLAFPAYPQLKLWPEAAVAVGDVPEALPRLYPGEDKRARQVFDGFAQSPLELKSIYVLAKGSSPEIARLGPQEAFVELVRHSYAVNLLEATGTASRHFRQCVKLARRISTYRLKRQNSLQSLSEVARLVEDHQTRGT